MARYDRRRKRELARARLYGKQEESEGQIGAERLAVMLKTHPFQHGREKAKRGTD